MFRQAALVLAVAVLAVRAQTAVQVPANGEVSFSNAEFGQGLYSNNANEAWEVTGPVGKSLEFNSKSFDLENACRYDQVRIIENGAVIGEFCGSDGPVGLQTSGNAVTVTFKTDGSVQRSGFQITVKVAKCPRGEKLCPNDDNICIGWQAWCNGTAQCPNNLDEENCPAPGSCGESTVKPVLQINGQKIVGGVVAEPHSWPWQVAFISKSSKSQFCGGSIVAPLWVVSAAHCCQRTAASAQVRVGAHNLDDQNEGAEDIDIVQIINHPQYAASTTDYDFCLLKLAKPIAFGRTTAPACLPDPADPVTAPGTECYISGWGTTSSGGSQSRKLLQTNVKITTAEQCNAAYGGRITDQMICAENPGKDSCQGDSGGPLVCKAADGKYKLAGITSWGRGCALAGYPGVYARSTAQLEWMRSYINVPV